MKLMVKNSGGQNLDVSVLSTSKSRQEVAGGICVISLWKFLITSYPTFQKEAQIKSVHVKNKMNKYICLLFIFSPLNRCNKYKKISKQKQYQKYKTQIEKQTKDK